MCEQQLNASEGVPLTSLTKEIESKWPAVVHGDGTQLPRHRQHKHGAQDGTCQVNCYEHYGQYSQKIFEPILR